MKHHQSNSIRLGSFLKQTPMPRLISPQKSKASSSSLNKSLQNSPSRRDPLTWGLQSNESTFETSYKSHFKHQNSFELSRKLFTDPDSPRNIQLNGSPVSNETPRFTAGKRSDSRKDSRSDPRNLLSDFEASESPRSGRKQYSEIKHKPDYTKDDSPGSYKLYNSEHSPRRYSPSNPASILNRIHLHHSQVSENFMSVHPESSEYDSHLPLYSRTFDELNTAGTSDLKKRMSPAKKGKRFDTSPSPRDSNEFVDLFSHNYTSVDSQDHTHKELEFTTKAPFQALGLRKTKYDERFAKSFYLGRSPTPNRAQEDSIQSSPEDHINNDSVDNRYSTNKSLSGRFTDNGANFDDSKVKQIEKGLSLILNSFCADKSLTLKTEPDMDVKTEKSFKTVSKSTQSGSKTPGRNAGATSRRTVEFSNEKPAAKEIRKPMKIKPVVIETVKTSNVKTGLLNGKIKQGAFSGVNKKYIA